MAAPVRFNFGQAMLGQGSPRLKRPRPSPIASLKADSKNGSWLELSRCARFALSVILCCGALTLTHPNNVTAQITGVAPRQQVNLNLRFAWGGGDATRWQGRLAVSEGTVKLKTSLGLAPDSPGHKLAEEGQLTLLAYSPTSFDGVDIEIEAPEDATLQIELSPADGSRPSFIRKVPLHDLIQERLLEPLDDRNNWLSVQRAWGDDLRIDLTTDALVYFANELLQFDIRPNQLNLTPGGHYDVRVELVAFETDEVIATETHELTADDEGNLEAIPEIEFELPEREGVYRVDCRVFPRRLGTPIFRPRVVAERTVEFVVISRDAVAARSDQWQAVLEFDSARPDWWDRLPGIHQLKVLPNFGKGPVDNGRQAIVSDADRNWTELAPGGWVAYPLPLKNIGEVHLIEVEMAGTSKQQLGMSFVEPNTAGNVLPLGPDSGVVFADQPGWPLTANPVSSWHGMLAWPNSQSPWLIIHNLDQESAARFGRVRASVRQESEESLSSMPGWNIDELPRRRFAMLLDSPLIPESFGAPERFDQIADRTLDDWSTFWLAGLRMVESMRLRKQRSAVISVLNEGSTIYPSRYLDPTPKYDSGAYFASGQDPVRKDVLEMLFRIFDREGLTLIPQVEFSSPLPSVERNLFAFGVHRGQPTDAFLISDEEVLNGQYRPVREPAYNPISPDVQAAMLEVINELVDRYGHHKSFGGLSIRMGPNTYTHFPSDRIGYDFTTVKRFLLDQGLIDSQSDSDTVTRNYFEVVRNHPESFLRWRASQLSSFYGESAAAVRRANDTSQLYLSAANLFRSPTATRSLHPRIQGNPEPLETVLLGQGLVPALMNRQPHVVLLAPTRVAPAEALAKHRVELHMENAGQFEAQLSSTDHLGSFGLQPVAPLLLPDFEKDGPFGAENNRELVLFPRSTQPGPLARQRFARQLAQSDEQVFIDGAMLAQPFYDESTRQFADEFQQLPDVPFEDVRTTAGNSTRSPLTIRQATVENKTYVYIVNSTPWSLTAELPLTSDRRIVVRSLTDRELQVDATSNSSAQLRLNFAPYDLISLVFENSRLQLGEARVTYDQADEILTVLHQQLRIYQSEVKSAGARPLPWVTPVNSSFEDRNLEDSISGWQVARSEGVDISVKTTQAHTGSHALKITSDGRNYAWVRSDPLPVPETGRLSISVWLRLADGAQAPLRIAIEGRYLGNEYYRYAQINSIGQNDSDRRLTSQWKRFVVHFDDLPPEGLTDLRVGFDLKAGSVWVDEVVTHDFWLDEQDVVALLIPPINLLGSLDQGDYVTCLRYLETYWARQFLTRPSLRRNSTTPVIADARGRESRSGLSRNLLDRMKALAPQKIIPFR